MTGKVFDIRRFSTHDGDGIRTTVFLKGCPLKCVWCQNPEGISIRKRPIYFENRCIHCKTCIAKSKNQGVTMENDQIHIHPNRNENWNTIIDWCPTGAIAMDSREMSVEMVMEEIRKDKSFYRYGNGGVTISGGEPLLQWKFTKELLKACKKEGIHTAIETSLYADQEVLKEILPYLDRIFADFKLATEKDHMHYTGVSNQKIKDNIRYLLETSNRDKVIIRTPMIPGMTATKDNIKEIAKLILKSLEKRLNANEINVTFTESAVSKIAKSGFDPVYGARPLRRAIQNEIEDMLSEEIIDGNIKSGDSITVDVEDDKFTVKK